RPADQTRNESPGLLVRQRGERDRRCVRLAATPRRAPLEQLGSARADDEESDTAGPVDEMVDEVEEDVVGPVQVLEDRGEGRICSARLEERPPRHVRLLRPVAARPRGLEPKQRAKV